MRLVHFNADAGGRMAPCPFTIDQLEDLFDDVARACPTLPLDVALHQRRADMLDHYHRGERARLDAIASTTGRQTDAGSLAGPQDLEHRYAQVITERHKRPTWLGLARRNSEVDVGAETHRQDILKVGGEVAVYRPEMSAAEIPTIDAEMESVKFGTAIYVTSWKGSIFEEMSLRYAGRMINKATIARGVMERFHNQRIVYGLPDDKVYGILNYPYCPRATSGLTLDSNTSFDAALAELDKWAVWAQEQTGQAFEPDTLALGLKLYNYFNRKLHSQNPNVTVLGRFLENNDQITRVVAANELDEGSSSYGFFYEDSSEGLEDVVPAGLTILPAEVSAFGNRTYMFMKHGGVVERVPAANLIVEFTRSF